MNIQPNSKTASKKPFRYALLAAAVFSTGFACNLGSSPEVIPTSNSNEPTLTADTPVPGATSTSSASGDTDAQPQSSGAGLSGAQRQRLAAATVLIFMTDVEDGEFFPFGIGSGTIISPDGLILTNSHVAQPSAGGFGADPDVLIIALNEDEAEPPIPAYIAEVAAVDGFLDLAVIRITSSLDGARVDSSGLDLPFVELGNSDDLHLGDTINIFGFPGIGGNTITFTKGSVSGFSAEEPIGSRAWIKTDATIAGGNSGGLGANDFGQLIGVPTQGGSGSADSSIADCRVVQDTNGDGQLTDDDTCIPIGGFINSLRPVNLAEPLIRAAQTGVVYESPFDSPGQTVVVPAGDAVFTFVAWSELFDEQDGCPIQPVAEFGTDAEQISGIFDYSGMVDGQEFALYWLLDEEVVVEDNFLWDFGSAAPCFPFFVHNGGDPLPEGVYTLLLYTGEGLPLIAEVTTQVTDAPGAEGVLVSGQVVDAETGNPIAGAAVIVLKPGVDVDDWLAGGSDEDIYTWAETDANGEYTLPDLLLYGVNYPAAAGASDQGYFTSTGFFLFESGDPSDPYIVIELSR